MNIVLYQANNKIGKEKCAATRKEKKAIVVTLSVVMKYLFYKNKGHLKKDYIKYKK